MSTLRTLAAASLLASLATAALAQTATPPATHYLTPGLEPGAEMSPVEDNRIFAHVLLDQLEGRLGGAGGDFRWDGQGWIGTDYDKLWIKTEGYRRANGEVDDGRHEFLYDRAITTYFDVQAGLRSDIDSRPSRHWGAFGIQGLAPMFFDVEATAYASDQGHFAARLKGSYDLLITQRLVLQPEAELNLYSKADPARLTGAGFSDLDVGLRLRYEITRKFAPYIGVAYENKFGQTASFARRAGESTNGVRLLFGVRVWF
ncbi:MAG TPA: copper resistance protein B [Stellaceae bacterium]|nr:copper resistance protein B [Stellaceae bacterium]